MRRSIRRLSPVALAVMALPLSACGTATLDLAGYPDAAHDRLYRDGRLGDDKGLADFDLRKAWRAVSETPGVREFGPGICEFGMT